MAIIFAKFFILSVICGTIQYIACLDGEYYELPTVTKNTLTDAEKNQIIIWTSTIMENKTIHENDLANSLTSHLTKTYSSSNWIVNVGTEFGTSIAGTNVKFIHLEYLGKAIIIWNLTC